MTIEKPSTHSASRIERRSALLLGLAAASTLVFGAETPVEAAARCLAPRQDHRALCAAQGSRGVREILRRDASADRCQDPGVKRLELSKIAPGPDGAAPRAYRIAELYFTSKKQMDKVMATQAAKDTVADIPNFATGGFTVLACRRFPSVGFGASFETAALQAPPGRGKFVYSDKTLPHPEGALEERVSPFAPPLAAAPSR